MSKEMSLSPSEKQRASKPEMSECKSHDDDDDEAFFSLNQSTMTLHFVKLVIQSTTPSDFRRFSNLFVSLEGERSMIFVYKV